RRLVGQVPASRQAWGRSRRSRRRPTAAVDLKGPLTYTYISLYSQNGRRDRLAGRSAATEAVTLEDKETIRCRSPIHASPAPPSRSRSLSCSWAAATATVRPKVHPTPAPS